MAIWYPTAIDTADVPSCALVIVNVSVATAVTLIISALTVVGITPEGQTVQLNGGVGNNAP